MDSVLDQWVKRQFGEAITPSALRAKLESIRTYSPHTRARAMSWVYEKEGLHSESALQAAVAAAEAAKETSDQTAKIATATKWAAIAAATGVIFPHLVDLIRYLLLTR